MTAERRNIYLVGPMGSGKTTIGSRLAERLGLEFVDCDQEIEARTGVSVNLIFDIEGESGFRQRESRILKELCARKGVLLATGGGAVVSESNRKLLRTNGLVIYLQTSIAQQLERLRRDRSRPLLQTDDKEAKLRKLAKLRNPLYEEVANLVVPVKHRSLDRSVDMICQAIATSGDQSVTEPGAQAPRRSRFKHRPS